MQIQIQGFDAITGPVSFTANVERMNSDAILDALCKENGGDVEGAASLSENSNMVSFMHDGTDIAFIAALGDGLTKAFVVGIVKEAA